MPHGAPALLRPTGKRAEPAVAVRKPQPEVSGNSHKRERPTRTFLVPTDFSPRDATAVQEAVALARIMKARLTLLHVIDVNDPAWVTFAGSSDEFMRQIRTKAHSEMDRLMESVAGEPIEMEALIVEGLPSEEIVKCTEHSDLVIIIRPPPKAFWKLFSKKTAERVIDQAECGVLVV